MATLSETYRVRIGDDDFALENGPTGLTLDGTPREATLVPTHGHNYVLTVDGHPHRVTLEGRDGDTLTLRVDGTRIVVDVSDAQRLLLESFGLDTGEAAAQREVRAPMPGLVLHVRVQPGEAVEPGQGLLVLEAMKMENEIKAQHAATVARVHVAPGEAVTKGTLLVEMEAE